CARPGSYAQSASGQSGALFEAEHEVRVLDRLPGRALDEIVDRGGADGRLRALVDPDCDVARVGAVQPAGVHALLHGHERLRVVARAVERLDLGLGEWPAQAGVARD